MPQGKEDEGCQAVGLQLIGPQNLRCVVVSSLEYIVSVSYNTELTSVAINILSSVNLLPIDVSSSEGYSLHVSNKKLS